MADGVLIIGYGNPLRGDDSVGYQAAGRLQALIDNPTIQIVAAHQLTPEMAEPISRAARVIFIDAAVGPTPGEISESRPSPRTSGSFTHHATPEGLLAAAEALYGRAAEAVLYTITGADFGYGTGLSPPVSRALDVVVATVLSSASS